MPTKYKIFAVIATLLVLLDQATKYWVRLRLPTGRESIDVIDGLFMIVHAENKGAAFGMGTGMDFGVRMLIFGVFTVVALGVLGHMLWQLPANDRLQSFAIGFIASGAIGNAIDRIYKQQVTDFIRVYTHNESVTGFLGSVPFIKQFCARGTCEWPSWNVADAAIVAGLGIFVIHYLFFQRDEPVLEASPPERPLDDPSS